MALDDRNRQSLVSYFGTDGYDEYRRIARRLDTQHLSIQAPRNLVFVPGVMGSLLISQSKGGIWWVDVRTRKHLNDLRLAPDGQNDADPSHQIAPTTTDPSYEPFLTAVLAREEFGHEVFAYDWRKPLRASTTRLRDLILELHRANGGQPVHLVAHSMGGLVIRATLMDYGAELWPRIGRIVFLGTPHYGSPAIAGYLKNHMWGFDLMAVFGLYLSRETYRSLWGVLGLLPAPAGVYPGTRAADAKRWTPPDDDDPYVHPCANFDLYRVESWGLELTPSQANELQDALDAAETLYRQMYEAHEALDQSQRDRMAVIAGVGYRTLFRLSYRPRFPWLWDHMDKETRRIEGDRHREGDGRVPLASAELENVPVWYVKGAHHGLPNIPAVQDAVFEWLNGEDMGLPPTARAALSQHLGPEDFESQAPHLDGTAGTSLRSDDAGLYDLDPPDPARLQQLEEKLQSDKLPEFARIRLL